MDTSAGVVIRSQSGFYHVNTTMGRIICQLRGKLKRNRFDGDILAVGDKVDISIHAEGVGMVESIHPRTSMLARLAPTSKGIYRQILLANVEQIVLIFACTNPDPHLRMLDRYLVIAEKQDVPVVIVFNKLDLVTLHDAEKKYGYYKNIGYPVLFTSKILGESVEELKQRLTGKLNAFTGPSGVGKSTLLNLIQPGLGLAAREVSDSTSKGRHTTVVREMFTLPDGGFVVDTPGIKALALWDTEPEELDGYFPEIAPLVQYCNFNDCTHRMEPGCAVKKAVSEGSIHPARYESYLRLRYGE
jgi:ribosome biogenesis GTPase / thiamine phosphate phosphatase